MFNILDLISTIMKILTNCRKYIDIIKYYNINMIIGLL